MLTRSSVVETANLSFPTGLGFTICACPLQYSDLTPATLIGLVSTIAFGDKSRAQRNTGPLRLNRFWVNLFPEGAQKWSSVSKKSTVIDRHPEIKGATTNGQISSVFYPFFCILSRKARQRTVYVFLLHRLFSASSVARLWRRHPPLRPHRDRHWSTDTAIALLSTHVCKKIRLKCVFNVVLVVIHLVRIPAADPKRRGSRQRKYLPAWEWCTRQKESECEKNMRHKRKYYESLLVVLWLLPQRSFQLLFSKTKPGQTKWASSHLRTLYSGRVWLS